MSKSATTIDPIHPGEILKDQFLDIYGISATMLAAKLDVPPNRITRIIAGNTRITADTALLLAASLGTTPEFWLNLQMQFDLEVARGSAEIQERLKVVSGRKPHLETAAE